MGFTRDAAGVEVWLPFHSSYQALKSEGRVDNRVAVTGELTRHLSGTFEYQGHSKWFTLHLLALRKGEIMAETPIFARSADGLLVAPVVPTNSEISCLRKKSKSNTNKTCESAWVIALAMLCSTI